MIDITYTNIEFIFEKEESLKECLRGKVLEFKQKIVSKGSTITASWAPALILLDFCFFWWLDEAINDNFFILEFFLIFLNNWSVNNDSRPSLLQRIILSERIFVGFII